MAKFKELCDKAIEMGVKCGLGGWVTERDKEFLSEFLTSLPNKNQPLEVAELGVFQGGSSLIYLMSMPNCRFHAIDNWLGGPASPGYATIKEGFEDVTQIFKHRIVMHSGDSRDIGKNWNIMLDICMIDGNHDTIFPKTDIFNFMSWIKKDGYILVDDCDMSNVREAINNFLQMNPSFKFIKDTQPEGGKIVVYQKI